MKKHLLIALTLSTSVLGISYSTNAGASASNATPSASHNEIETSEDVDKFKSRALSGDRIAAHKLGLHYLYGSIICDQDFLGGKKRVDSKDIVLEMRKTKDPEALTSVCNPKEAIPWLKLAAEGNDPVAMNDLGAAYDEMGDTPHALKWYLKGAVGGSKPGQFNLAIALFVGRGVALDKGLALFWMRVAEENGPVIEGGITHPSMYRKMTDTARQRGVQLYEKYIATKAIPPESIPKLLTEAD
jgi:TPR repeat protein